MIAMIKLKRHEWQSSLIDVPQNMPLCSLTSPAPNSGKHFEGIGESEGMGRGGQMVWYIWQQPQGSCGAVSPGTRSLPALMEGSDICSWWGKKDSCCQSY